MFLILNQYGLGLSWFRQGTLELNFNKNVDLMDLFLQAGGSITMWFLNVYSVIGISAYFNKLVPNAGAVGPLWFLSFILEFGEGSLEAGAQGPKNVGTTSLTIHCITLIVHLSEQ
jgi:hypothetical protein